LCVEMLCCMNPADVSLAAHFAFVTINVIYIIT
jgi:hypothetical protein